MKKQLLMASLIAASGASFGQTVGDAALGTYNFTDNGLPQGGNTSQYWPQVFSENGEKSVIWTQGVSGDVGVFHTALNSNYIGSQIDTVVAFTGILNSDGDGTDLRTAYNANADKFCAIYRFADNLSVVTKDFSLKAKTFSSTDFTDAELVVEGPMDYANDLPAAWEMAAGPNNTFGMVYMSDGASSTNSQILFKTIDGATGVVTPASATNMLTGTVVSNFGAREPSVAWNEQEQVWGITYIWGTGNSTKIVFVALDASGSLLIPDKDVINDNTVLSTDPIIKTDGDGFVLVWKDFRDFQIPGNPSAGSGMPSSRLCQLTKTGDQVTNSGTSPFFDSNDNSLIVSNPYQYGVYLFQDVEVVTPGEKYGVTWVTQDAPYAVYFAEVQVSNTGAMNSTIPVAIDDATFTSDKVSMAYENGKYIISHMEYNSLKYKNRIAVGEFQAGGGGTGINEAEMKLNAYPNPTSGIVNFTEVISEITVLDMKGAVIETYNNVSQIDLSNLTEGIYLIKDDTGSFTKVNVIK
ncbi:MAG: hypothetical protein ACI9N1_001046 [Flavobacteriales bacterium]|jgi:hypothetical protein